MRVRVRPNRQVVTEAGHHYGGDELDVPDGTAAAWARLGAVEPVAGTLPEREGPSAAQGRANVRARIAEELRVDDTRSDRAIAAVVGCDHKTVAKARKAAAPAAPPPSDTLPRPWPESPPATR